MFFYRGKKKTLLCFLPFFVSLRDTSCVWDTVAHRGQINPSLRKQSGKTSRCKPKKRLMFSLTKSPPLNLQGRHLNRRILFRSCAHVSSKQMTCLSWQRLNLRLRVDAKQNLLTAHQRTQQLLLHAFFYMQQKGVTVQLFFFHLYTYLHKPRPIMS